MARTDRSCCQPAKVRSVSSWPWAPARSGRDAPGAGEAPASRPRSSPRRPAAPPAGSSRRRSVYGTSNGLTVAGADWSVSTRTRSRSGSMPRKRAVHGGRSGTPSAVDSHQLAQGLRQGAALSPAHLQSFLRLDHHPPSSSVTRPTHRQRARLAPARPPPVARTPTAAGRRRPACRQPSRPGTWPHGRSHLQRLRRQAELPVIPTSQIR